MNECMQFAKTKVDLLNMTRFQLSSSSNYETPQMFTSSPPSNFPSMDQRDRVPLYERIKHQGGNSIASTRLVALSPDGLQMHTLMKLDNNIQQYVIETHQLPIVQSDENSRNNPATGSESPTLIRTPLTDDICKALEVDPPLELVSVDIDASSTSDLPTGRTVTSCVCLYTCKNAFLLSLGLDRSLTVSVYGTPTPFGSPVRGEIIDITEPFERFLEGWQSTTIIRIRPAPQKYAHHVTICPKRCIAALIHLEETNEYRFMLHHSDGTITSPVEWKGSEEVSGIDQTEAFVDFCFTQSDGMAIFPSMSVLFLKRSGEVMTACPIVYNGAIVAKSYVQEALDYLEAIREELPNRNSARFRQIKAAEQYIRDVFNMTRSRNNNSNISFCTAQILTSDQETAAIWPVAVQGPVLIASQDENELTSYALTIEPFGSSEKFAGVSIGRTDHIVNFAAISPTSFIPRFAFESIVDSYDLNDDLYNNKLGAIVEEIQLSSERSLRSNIDTFCQISVISDPISSTLLHYVTSSFVGTISTNVMKVTNNNISHRQMNEPVRTTAWLNVTSSSSTNAAIIGSLVSDYSQTGHQLITRFSNASCEAINVSESQYRHELKAVLDDDNSSAIVQVSADPATHPFHEKIQPIVTRITTALGSLSKIVGTETKYTEIQPGDLGAVVSLRDKCDKDVVLPLLELKIMVENRRNQMKTTIESHKKSLQILNKQVIGMRDKMQELTEKMQRTEDVASELSLRSADVLSSANNVLPKLTNKEYEFFQDIARLQRKVDHIQKNSELVKVSSVSTCFAIKDKNVSEVTAQLSQHDIDNANKILKGASFLLKQKQKLLSDNNDRLQRIHEKVDSQIS